MWVRNMSSPHPWVMMNIEELRRKWAILMPLLDDEELKLLNAVICNEGSTMYRLSRITGLAISSTYKKTSSLAQRGLVEIVRLGKFSACRTTIRGLLTCFARGCTDDGYILGRVASMLRSSHIDVDTRAELLVLLSTAADYCLGMGVNNVRQPRDLVLSIIGGVMEGRTMVNGSQKRLVLGIIRSIEKELLGAP
ncbi:MAG: hypothetical protein RXQ96_05575 [Thermocladium sp.]|nr:MAG: hypothetical protein AT710_00780 [Thermocladium sp. ECH_B]